MGSNCTAVSTYRTGRPSKLSNKTALLRFFGCLKVALVGRDLCRNAMGHGKRSTAVSAAGGTWVSSRKSLWRSVMILTWKSISLGSTSIRVHQKATGAKTQIHRRKPSDRYESRRPNHQDSCRCRRLKQSVALFIDRRPHFTIHKQLNHCLHNLYWPVDCR